MIDVFVCENCDFADIEDMKERVFGPAAYSAYMVRREERRDT